ncbi:oxysterol-binding protein-related protein 11 [Folsomia candida]|uniref:Oxysterol-binding protein-related protein 11 n=1 Tax=Folsomia candida TaxID=158441 RepID=A0A226EX90_FOLCA|nr:oxysterol-binding protein-related protein 11 [Folsomia candida]XP_021967837.1 oxysterol-binding protein-related protein 11 [Folsomia candida]OXA36622.1 Oxysterol-binding protein-related protein 11 [Folsomia candida]OXA61451.1 Oxysterol-binding protein-related protein 11 [Folsomia candida]
MSELKLRQHYEGQLNKYTNVMKGWQFRWFVLHPDKGTLEYHVTEGEVRGSRPRGCLHLAGAVISPSEEDSHTFVVHAASGDLYKLRAVDAKERQEWITRLRVVAELHSQALSQTNSGLREGSGGLIVPTNASILDAFSQVTDWLTKAENAASDVAGCIDRFPISGPTMKCTDGEVLVLKATAQATLGCLEECLYALQLQQRACSSKQQGSHSSNKSAFGSTSSMK